MRTGGSWITRGVGVGGDKCRLGVFNLLASGTGKTWGQYERKLVERGVAAIVDKR